MVNEVESNSETTVSCHHNMQLNANKLDTKNTRLINSRGIKYSAPATVVDWFSVEKLLITDFSGALRLKG